MNRYLTFFLIFALSFVLLPYCATVKIRNETVPAMAVGEEAEKAVTKAETEDDEIVCRLCSLSKFLTEDESIKAAATALRTKKLYDAENAVTTENDDFYGMSLPSKEECVRLYGKDAVERTERLVRECDGFTVTYNGSPINALVHMFSAGATENVGTADGDPVPYLKSVPSEADKNADGFTAEQRASTAEVKKILEKHLKTTLPENETEWITDIKRTKSGAVIGVRLCGEQADGETARRLFGLRSPDFSYRIKDGMFIFTVKGYGNLAGLSLYGANEEAKNGKSFEQILEYYYTGATVEKSE